MVPSDFLAPVRSRVIGMFVPLLLVAVVLFAHAPIAIPNGGIEHASAQVDECDSNRDAAGAVSPLDTGQRTRRSSE